MKITIVVNDKELGNRIVNLLELSLVLLWDEPEFVIVTSEDEECEETNANV